tara:strand:+ start:211 stop:462 length:252 start_codon:yes stop_codon:yes gene_type:complete
MTSGVSLYLFWYFASRFVISAMTVPQAGSYAGMFFILMMIPIVGDVVVFGLCLSYIRDWIEVLFYKWKSNDTISKDEKDLQGS